MKAINFYLIGALSFALLGSSCGVHLAELQLEDPVGVRRQEEAFNAFKARTVYSNTTGDEVWGPEACGEIAVGSRGAFEGNAIRVIWNKTPDCDWVGMGIGWDAWQPKDLSGIMDETSLSFQLRAGKGESRIPIMIFLLEDYAGVQSAAPLRAGYMERYPLDTTWRKVILPMSDFPAQRDGLDLTNIKQLIVELQGQADVMLDDIQIIRKPAQEAGSASGPMASITPLSKRPVALFEGSLPNGWGLERNECRDFRLDTEGLELDWWDSCPYSPMGFSWNRWLGVDLGDATRTAQLVVDLKWKEGNGALMAGFEDYGGARTLLNLRDYPASADGLLRIPMQAFDFGGRKIQSGNIKHFMIDVSGRGAALVRSIRIENLPENAAP